MENTTCETLDLSYNRLTDESIPALAEMLEANATLKDLDLTGNEFSDDAFDLIGDTLKGQKGLKVLTVGAMPVSDVGIGHLAAGLAENGGVLAELCLEGAELSEAARAVLTEMLTTNKTVEITGVEPPIVRPPDPVAEPEPEPEPKPRRKKKKRTVLVAPPAETEDVPEFMRVKLKKKNADINYLADGTLDDVKDDGAGFLGALSVWRQREVKEERQSEMDALDPAERDAKWQQWEQQDNAKGVAGGVKASAKAAPKSTMFGVPLTGLPTATPDGGGDPVPAVLVTMRRWITKHGGHAAPDLFLKGAKGEAYMTTKLSLNDPAGCPDCTDVYVAAALLLDFFREQPGGVLAGLPAATLEEMDSEEGALASKSRCRMR
eukprot:SAG22_NODE_200_length_15420_cov_4.424581_2_plen_377_part_00